MKVQRMCKKLVLLLLLAALLCQTALAVDSEFLYGQRDISWIGMEGDSFLKLDGNAADRNHPSAAPGYWLDVYIPLVVDISSDCVLQDVTVEALEPESSYEYNQSGRIRSVILKRTVQSSVPARTGAYRRFIGTIS